MKMEDIITWLLTVVTHSPFSPLVLAPLEAPGGRQFRCCRALPGEEDTLDDSKVAMHGALGVLTGGPGNPFLPGGPGAPSMPWGGDIAITRLALYQLIIGGTWCMCTLPKVLWVGMMSPQALQIPHAMSSWH